MKKLLLFLALAFIPALSFGQKLNLDELTSIFKMDQSQCQEFLDKKNWDDEKPLSIGEESEYWIERWSYGKSLIGIGNSEGDVTTVIYQCSKTARDLIFEKVQEYKMKPKVNSMDGDGNRYSIFVGSKFAIKFTVRLDETFVVALVTKSNIDTLE